MQLSELSTDALEAYVQAASKVMELPIADAYLNDVVEHFAVATRMANLVLSFPLPDEAGVAPVFVP